MPAPSLAERLERLVHESNALATEPTLERVLQQVCDLAQSLISARYAAVGMLNPDGETLESFFTAGLSGPQRAAIGALPSGRGVLGLVIREGRVVRLCRLQDDPHSVGFPDNHPPMHSFLGVPIAGRHGILGELYLTEKIGAAEFSEEDAHVAMLLANRAATAIENARLHEQGASLLAEVQGLHRTRERFFAMVNHELRNALAAVHGWAEMLVRKKDPSTVPRAAFEVLDSAEAAIALINDLLDLSRLDENRLRPVVREVQCLPMLREAVSRVTPEAENRGITIRVLAAHELGTCVTDAARVEQILINVLRNAIRHSPAGGTIVVRAGLEPNLVRILVDDEGPGVAPDQLETIFDVYETNPGEEQEGVGLGLPLSRRLARLLGGELCAIHRPEAGGRFQLDLPHP